MGKVVQKDFFKKNSDDRFQPEAENNSKPEAPTDKQPAAENKQNSVAVTKARISPMHISPNVMSALKQTSKVLIACGREKAAKEIDGIYLSGTRNMFTVAVVGEFSR